MSKQCVVEGMRETDYPDLFYTSDRASIDAQTTYFRLQKGYLSLLVLASITSSASLFIGHSGHHLLLTASTIFLAISLILLWIIRAQRYDQIWFDCRAVAESVKTSAWRYMMQTPPYRGDIEESLVDKDFIQELDEIRKMRPGIERYLSSHGNPVTSAISERMRKIRSLSLDERKDFYLRERLLDQKQWYENKARIHRSSASRWFWTVVVLQIFVLTVAIVQLVVESYKVDLVPIFMTLVAVFVAWSQIRRHDELTQGYSLAAQELSLLESLSPHIRKADDLEEFVLQTENTISREHTLWCARRDISLGSSLHKSTKKEGNNQ